MKKVQINQAKTEIDWSKPMWVQNKNSQSIILLTNGVHSRDRFSGTCMPCEDAPFGSHSNLWLKEYYAPLVGEIQFTISNANDEK
jgi:hypothetical protein